MRLSLSSSELRTVTLRRLGPPVPLWFWNVRQCSPRSVEYCHAPSRESVAMTAIPSPSSWSASEIFPGFEFRSSKTLVPKFCSASSRNDTGFRQKRSLLSSSGASLTPSTVTCTITGSYPRPWSAADAALWTLKLNVEPSESLVKRCGAGRNRSPAATADAGRNVPFAIPGPQSHPATHAAQAPACRCSVPPRTSNTLTCVASVSSSTRTPWSGLITSSAVVALCVRASRYAPSEALRTRTAISSISVLFSTKSRVASAWGLSTLPALSTLRTRNRYRGNLLSQRPSPTASTPVWYGGSCRSSR